MQRRQRILFLLFGVLAAVLFVVDLSVGAVPIPIREVLAALTGSGNDPVTTKIILNIRLLKAVVALLAGAALAVSGLQMQTLFRNPLAGPYVLGISSGASLGVAIFLLGAPLLGLTGHPLISTLGIAGAAWIGSALILMLIAAVSRRIKDIMVILILGMMFSSGVGAIVQILQYLSNEAALKSFVVWTMGSLGDVTLGQLGLLLPAVVLGLVLAVAVIKPLNLLLLGENYARTMGLDIRRSRQLIFLSTTLLAGTVTAFCGPIGFIGLAVPHVARILFADADHRILVPASILTGIVVMLLCDVLAKLLTFPINTITALLGIPIVIWVVIRNKKHRMIRLNDLTIGYGHRILLQHASATIPAGELVALVGRNGTGKSTLLRAIAGLGERLGGEIRLDGHSLETLLPQQLATTVSFVTTERVRIPNLRCEDVVALGRAPYTNWIGRVQEQDKAIVERSLELVGMAAFAEKTMDRMSDGECQRVMIARALAQDTPIILLDEPTSFLDLPNRYELCTLLRQLAHDHRKCILFSTHELDIALSLCDSIALIDPPVLRYLPTPDMACSGYIERLFSNSFVTFDTESGTIKVRK